MHASRSLGQYSLRKSLYKGELSCVCEAVDRNTGAHVALKVYKKSILEGPERVQLEREMQIHRGLSHRNIVDLLTVFEDSKGVYLVQSYAQGGDLFTVLAGCGSFDEARTASTVIVPLLSALDYIHAKGIIHRDIKTENILFDADGTLKLADFGLAIDSNTSRPGTRLGTWEYMAPEVHRCPFVGEENATQATYSSAVDCWAVGILAHELLVGRPLFKRLGRQITCEDITTEDLKLPLWLSPAASSFIRSALCPDPSRRPTAGQLLKHRWLQPFVKGSDADVSVKPARSTLTVPADLDIRVRSVDLQRGPLSTSPARPDPRQPPAAAAAAAATDAFGLHHRPPSKVSSYSLLGEKCGIDHRRTPSPQPPRPPLAADQRSSPLGAAGLVMCQSGQLPGRPTVATCLFGQSGRQDQGPGAVGVVGQSGQLGRAEGAASNPGLGGRQDQGYLHVVTTALSLPSLVPPNRACSMSIGSPRGPAREQARLGQRGSCSLDLQVQGGGARTPRLGAGDPFGQHPELCVSPRRWNHDPNAAPGPIEQRIMEQRISSCLQDEPAAASGLLSMPLLPMPSLPASGPVSARAWPPPHAKPRERRRSSQLLELTRGEQEELPGAHTPGGKAASPAVAPAAALAPPAAVERQRRSIDQIYEAGGGQSKVQALYSMGKALFMRLSKQGT